MKKLDFSVTGPEPVRTLLEYAGAAAGRVTVGTARFRPHERLPAEGTGSHEGDEISYIISGSLTGESGGRPFRVGAGDLTLIPAGEEHWAVAGPEPVEIIFVMVGPAG